MDDGVRILTMAETAVTPAELAALFNQAFGDYEGVMQASPEIVAWYLRRPGLGAEHVFLALEGDEPVGGAMVTVARVVLGGAPISCGIVDSVMTRPDRRGRGIATALMEHAVAWMRGAGLSASLLYTERDSAGHRIYRRLGYRERATVTYCWVYPAPRPAEGPLLRSPAETEADSVRALLNEWLGGHDGFVAVDAALWAWRRRDRPTALPTTVFLLEDSQGVAATGTLCSGQVRLSGKPVDLVLMTDVAGRSPEDRASMVRGLMRHVPPGRAAALLTDSLDPTLTALARRLGMAQHEEVAMALPLDAAGAAALTKPPRAWYTLAESLIGL